jgi:DNA modification methylase
MTMVKEAVQAKNLENLYQIGSLVRKNKQNSAYIIEILEKLGRLPKQFDGMWLIELLDSDNEGVRFLAIKNLAKLTNVSFLALFSKISQTDVDTNVRREAVSAIGRMREPVSKEILYNMLKDNDPKVVCQAIRGLLVFKGEEEVDKRLKKLSDHQNEMVSAVIRKEYFPQEKYQSGQSHIESYDYLKNVVVNGDTIEVMRVLKDESVHLTFTSPPYYNARDYSIYPSYKAYLEFLAEVFAEVYRITKEGRFLLLNTSPVIVPRVSRAHSSKRYPIPFDIHHYLMEIGWEFIDDIVWVKPEASVKNRIGGFQQHRKPLGYKPNTVTEYIMVYRKQTDKLLDWNIHQYPAQTVSESKVSDGFETTDKVHSAVFPQELCERVIKYYSYKGDLVFDPFGGSGAIGKTAKLLDRFFFLTERDKTYFSYMKSKFGSELSDEYPIRFLSLEGFKSTML